MEMYSRVTNELRRIPGDRSSPTYGKGERCYRFENTPHGSVGIVQVPPKKKARVATDSENTPHGSVGIVQVQPTVETPVDRMWKITNSRFVSRQDLKYLHTAVWRISSGGALAVAGLEVSPHCRVED